jgi:hypothetical protein
MAITVTHNESGKTAAFSVFVKQAAEASTVAATQATTEAAMKAATQMITETMATHASPTSIAIASYPSKTSYYVGDSLVTEGLTLTVAYSDGSAKTINSGFSCRPSTLAEAGTQIITVMHNTSGLRTSFIVIVEK